MTKLWNFVYFTEEEHEETWLMKDTTKERFRADSIAAYVEACKEAIKVGQDDFTDGIAIDSSVSEPWQLKGSSAQDLYPRAVEAMVRKGYVPIHADATFAPFGWASVMQEDWSGHVEEDIDAIREAIKEADLTKVKVQHWTKEEMVQYWEKEATE